jgi:hypothetical protein
MSIERNIDWANIVWTTTDWDTVDLIELRTAAMADLDPEVAAKYGVASFDAALVCVGVLAPNETVDSVEAAKAEQPSR